MKRAGLAEKREAIVRGARAVFGRDGYTRASIGSIAKEADVSTRTIYNHFDGGKSELFRVVVTEGAEQIVAAQLDLIDRYLRKVTDLESDLVAFAHGWIEPLEKFPDHFALVRQLNAEVGHLPPELLEAWQEAGPRKTFRVLAERFAGLAAEGLIEADDPERAALHFIHLTGTEVTARSYHGAVPLPRKTVDELIASGVRAYLRGYLPRG
ncbi:TetR/AcrR family transcriptional regulator [Streptomyces beijiangensis]|uniref:TetR/AcrR family transcriptional regulator n=1 Tax=Streptomyces beijiangensis TaxID=163361 RepID=A0A939JLD0_9ACTN|nr:TetR/AcrR family transcriptional regulator [Streptomyces beijiangensis]